MPASRQQRWALPSPSLPVTADRATAPMAPWSIFLLPVRMCLPAAELLSLPTAHPFPRKLSGTTSHRAELPAVASAEPFLFRHGRPAHCPPAVPDAAFPTLRGMLRLRRGTTLWS